MERIAQSHLRRSLLARCLRCSIMQMDEPLPALGQYLLGVAIALDTMNTGNVPAIDPKTATGQQAHEYVLDRQARIWPGLVIR